MAGVGEPSPQVQHSAVSAAVDAGEEETVIVPEEEPVAPSDDDARRTRDAEMAVSGSLYFYLT